MISQSQRQNFSEPYDRVCQIDDNFTRALVIALTLFTNEIIKNIRQIMTILRQLNDDLRAHVSDMTAKIDFLKNQVTNTDSQ
jgi:hypothetical protein